MRHWLKALALLPLLVFAAPAGNIWFTEPGGTSRRRTAPASGCCRAPLDLRDRLVRQRPRIGRRDGRARVAGVGAGRRARAWTWAWSL